MATYYSARDSRGYRIRMEVTPGTQDVANNTTSVSWALYAECQSTYFASYTCTFSAVLDGTAVLSVASQYKSFPSANSSILLGSGTQTITHTADGSKTLVFSGSFKTDTSGSYGTVGTCSLSSSVVLTTIPRASQPTLDAASKDFGGTFTITTNRADSSFTHNLYYAFGSIGNTLIASGVGASTTWTAPTSLGSQIPTAMSGVGTITCDTYSGATLIGSKTVSFTLTVPSSWKAVLSTSHSGFSWVNSPASLTGYVIQNISTLTLTLAASLNNLVSSYGTTITAYQVRFDTYNSGELTYSNAAISKSTGLVAVSGTQYAYYRVKDARGNWSNEVQEQVMGTGSTIYPYAAPANNGFNVTRNATVLTTADYQMKFSRSPINNANTWNYQRQYYNGSSWINVDGSAVNIAADSITSTLTHALPYSEATVYQVRVKLSDLFSTVYYEDTLPTSDVPFVLTQYGAGIGKIPTNSGTYDLEVGTGGIKSDGDIAIPNDKSFDFSGTNATIRSNGSGALVLAGTDVYLRPNGDTTTNQLLIPDTGAATFNGSTVLTAANILNYVYPIGSIYISVSSTSPSTLFGGTWVTFSNGRALVGWNSVDTDFDTAEKYGGSKTVTLTESQMPTHTHIQNAHGHRARYSAAMPSGTTYHAPTSTGTLWKDTGTWIENATATNQNTGGGMAHDNMPPYMVVYMWKRTA